MNGQPVRRLLVIRLGALGDLVHVSASLQAVKTAYPAMEIHFLTSPAYENLIADLAEVDKVWILDKKQGLAGFLRLAGRLKEERLDAAINLHPSLKTRLLVFLGGIKKGRTYAKEKIRPKGAKQRGIPRLHAVQDFYRPFQRLLDLPSTLTCQPMLSLRAGNIQEKPAGEQWVGLIIGVGGKRGNRAWLLGHYETLITGLLEVPHRRILLIGGPEEVEQGRMLAEKLRGRSVENHCGRHDILDTARLLAQCDLVVGGDTGPMHLAAAVGAPMVAIYGPTSVARTGPLARHELQAVLPAPGLPCWPCELPHCPLGGEDHLACMRRISPVEVHYACETLLVARESDEAPRELPR